jgi:uncharacterized protein (DUF983 family)
MKRTKLYSVLFNKCPRCHEGNFFITKNPFDFANCAKIHPSCNVCGESFMKEVGFFYGSMYVSYGLTIALGVVHFLTLYVMLGLSEFNFLVVFCVSAIILWTSIFRKARLIWINLFVKYKKKIVKS